MQRWDLLLKRAVYRYRTSDRMLVTAGFIVMALLTACATTPPDEPETASEVLQEDRETDKDQETDLVDQADISLFRDVPVEPAPEMFLPAEMFPLDTPTLETPEIDVLEQAPEIGPEIVNADVNLPSTDALADTAPVTDEELTDDTTPEVLPDVVSMLEQAPPLDESPAPLVESPLDESPAPPAEPTTPPAEPPPGPSVSQSPAAPELSPDIEQSSAPTRELNAGVGEEVSVELPGLGWIYLGSDDSGAPELRRRIHHAETTEFVFRTHGEGTHRLQFQRQDLTLGSEETQDLVLNTVPVEDLANVEQDAFSEDESMEDAGVDSSEPERPEESAADMSPRAMHEELENALLEGRDSEAEELLQRLLDAGYLPEAGLLQEAAERRAERGEIGGAIDLLEQRLSEYPSRNGRDRVHYLLGSLYEADSDRRNMQESRLHYSVVVNEYPRSRYLDESQRRINYQNRHFFEIR
ncbi:MAG: hypothetical protein LC641_13260 [Spirochaeta sp.]|nr:hypothetical protein [Spirochaeta sp.]